MRIEPSQEGRSNLSDRDAFSEEFEEGGVELRMGVEITRRERMMKSSVRGSSSVLLDGLVTARELIAYKFDTL